MSIYSDSITEAETKLGFKLVEIPNPDVYAFSPPTIKVVICEVGPQRVIKLNDPNGRINYKRQKLIKLEHTSPQWTPADDIINLDPAIALADAQREVGKEHSPNN